MPASHAHTGSALNTGGIIIVIIGVGMALLGCFFCCRSLSCCPLYRRPVASADLPYMYQPQMDLAGSSYVPPESGYGYLGSGSTAQDGNSRLLNHRRSQDGL